MNVQIEQWHRFLVYTLIIFILALNYRIVDGADVNTLLVFKRPGIHIWSNQSGKFNPYETITKHDKTFSDYMIRNELGGTFFLSLMFYDSDLESLDMTGKTDDEKKEILQNQNEAKEYYWTFFNTTGILPSVTFMNTTTEVELDLFTVENDFIRYDGVKLRKGAYGDLTVPPFDLVMEVPVNSRSFQERRTAIELFTWGYLRWRLSAAELVTWDTITKDQSLHGTGKPSPEEIEFLTNPCIPDMSVFSLITKSASGGANRVYFIVPLLNQTHWDDITSGFCTHSDVPDECGSVSQVVMTNNYILGLSNLGLYVSVELNSTFNSRHRLEPELRPVVDFRLYNPCSEIKDLLICFDTPTETASPSIESMRLFYTPICHSYQRPNYRDLVILTVFHEGQPSSGNSSNSTTSNSTAGSGGGGPVKCLTVLYGSAPYFKFDILMKCIDKYMEFPIKSLAGIFYHHQLNRFDMVIEYENNGVQHFVRMLVPMPDPKEVRNYYNADSFGNSSTQFKAHAFPSAFVVKKVQVFPGSMDVFFLGNQLFIAESGGELVYNSVSNFADNDALDYCSFNHPDRTFICVNDAHTILLVGQVGSQYGMREVFASEIKEFQEVAIKENWIAAPTAGSSPSPSPTTSAAFRHLRYTVSFSGTIQMWYIKGFEFQGGSSPPAPASPSPDDTPGQFNLVTISPQTLQFLPEISHGPLVPFMVDAITAILYEAVIDPADEDEEAEVKYRYISRVNVGNNIRCVNTSNKGGLSAAGHVQNSNEFSCELYIRHIKRTHHRLPGFRSVIYGFVQQSIPMDIIDCDYEVTLEQESNRAAISGNCGKCLLGADKIGKTIYIPDKFSILIEKSGGGGGCGFGLATRKANAVEKFSIPNSSSYLIDLSTKEYKTEKGGSGGDMTWMIQGGECIFQLALIQNDLMRSSGGHIILDLQDSVSFVVTLSAQTQKAQLALQRPLITLSNSNPKILHVNTQFSRFDRFQRLEIFLRPTGFGVGITSIVVRSMSCTVRCVSPCSLTFIFQVMLKEGRALQIRYPTPNTDKDDDEEAAEKRLINIPVNYRPPSLRGVKIPLSRNVYNAYPERKRIYDNYRISQETGEYKHCLHKSTREECNCRPEDTTNDDPIYSDCKEKAYRVIRAREYIIRITYPPIMDPAKQNPKFYLPRHHLSVELTEVNGRTEYSIESNIDEYLVEINKDKNLNLGNRFYSADKIAIRCYGTGLFHFKVSLGHFDSFGDVSGHFMLYSVEAGLDDVTYLIVLFLALTCCMILLFCGFIRVRKRLVSHLPIHGETHKIKIE